MKILVMNGPNINFLGIREKNIYGKMDYEALIAMIKDKADQIGAEVEVFQDNGEGPLIDRIQAAYTDGTDGIIINPGAYTHYSIAIRDALASIELPIIELHISNVHKREEFRHVSVTAPVCTAQMTGFGVKGYLYAMDAMADMINEK